MEKDVLEYFKRKEAEERKRIETEAINRLMEIGEEGEGTPPEPPTPQTIEEAIEELKNALKSE